MMFFISRVKGLWPVLLLFFLLAAPPRTAAAPADLPSPEPRFIERGPGRLAARTVSIDAGKNGATTAARALTAFLTERGALAEGRPADLTVVLRRRGDPASPGLSAAPARRWMPPIPQGYLLRTRREAGKNMVVIEGNDDAGLFYGVQTLKQLLRTGAMPNIRVEDGPAIASRGVVEGFYGAPWTHAQRLAQLRFYGALKMNLYIYAPKNDPYHRDKWRAPYPADELARLRELIATARENEVEFVYALSPGLDLRFDGAAGQRDFAALRSKLESLYAIGARRFAVCFDDIENKNGAKQAFVLNRLQREFADSKGNVGPLLTVPTEYCTADMTDGAAIKPYTRAFSKTLDSRIQVMYTGPGVVCESLPRADAARVSRIYQRKMAVWWNYPADDYFPAKLALGPVSGLDASLYDDVGVLAVNPMEHAELSKIAVQTAAAYAWNPARYRADAAWNKALRMQFGPLADAMECFAGHSTYMDNRAWARAGRPDAPAMRKTMDALWAKLRARQDAAAEITALRAAFAAMTRAAQTLRGGLPPAVLAECGPQLAWFAKLAAYDAAALQMIEAKLQNDEPHFQSLKRQTQARQEEIKAAQAKIRLARTAGAKPDQTLASLSETVAAAFLQEALQYASDAP